MEVKMNVKAKSYQLSYLLSAHRYMTENGNSSVVAKYTATNKYRKQSDLHDMKLYYMMQTIIKLNLETEIPRVMRGIATSARRDLIHPLHPKRFLHHSEQQIFSQ